MHACAGIVRVENGVKNKEKIMKRTERNIPLHEGSLPELADEEDETELEGMLPCVCREHP